MYLGANLSLRFGNLFCTSLIDPIGRAAANVGISESRLSCHFLKHSFNLHIDA